MLAKTFGSSVFGVQASLITIEVNVIKGTKFFMVGLPDNAVKESEQRVESAIKFSGFNFPRQKTIVNLAPADIKKVGSLFDLPIAIGILKSSDQLSISDKFEDGDLEKTVFIGELALDGSLRSVTGVLPIVISMFEQGFTRVILPKENANEASVVDGVDVIGVIGSNIRQNTCLQVAVNSTF